MKKSVRNSIVLFSTLALALGAPLLFNELQAESSAPEMISPELKGVWYVQQDYGEKIPELIRMVYKDYINETQKGSFPDTYYLEHGKSDDDVKYVFKFNELDSQNSRRLISLLKIELGKRVEIRQAAKVNYTNLISNLSNEYKRKIQSCNYDHRTDTVYLVADLSDTEFLRIRNKYKHIKFKTHKVQHKSAGPSYLFK
ncbi:hypothetical protein SY83_09855 [Paenibacillus swuensis]|uniref:Uncharacterized protein n=1 Tax=Paenibacillus swuensis TaxID=1178515 RepID=A0A172TI13_9BACL|nr:hypothetical protein SY83_09855 [Paenibacillus swuensis]